MRSVAARVTSKWLAVADAELIGHEARFEPGNAVNGHGRALLSFRARSQRQHQRHVQLLEPGPQMDAAPFQQPGGKSQPDGGVMVAAGQHHVGAGAGQPDKGVVQQPDDVDAGQGAVIHVAGDEDHIDGQFLDRRDQLVDKGALGIQHADAVEGPAQVPVGGVQ